MFREKRVIILHSCLLSMTPSQSMAHKVFKPIVSYFPSLPFPISSIFKSCSMWPTPLTNSTSSSMSSILIDLASNSTFALQEVRKERWIHINGRKKKGDEETLAGFLRWKNQWSFWWEWVPDRKILFVHRF